MPVSRHRRLDLGNGWGDGEMEVFENEPSRETSTNTQ